MENFDELMRQKYNNDDPAGRFEFREEYWEQAQALIEADEARRKRRRLLFWWWFFAGFLLLGAGGIGWWKLDSGKTNADASGEKNQIQQSVTSSNSHEKAPNFPVTQTNQNNTENNNSETSESINTSANSGTTANNETRSNNNLKNTGENTENRSAAVEKKPGNNNTRSDKNTPKSTATSGAETASQTRTTAGKNADDKNSAGRRAASSGNDGNTQKGSVSDAASGPKVESLKAAEKSATAGDKTPATAEGTNSPNTAGNAANTSQSNNSSAAAIAEQQAAENAEALKKLIDQLFSIPLPFPQASSERKNPLETPAKAEEPPAEKIITPVKDKRFSFGVMAAGTLYNPSPDNRRLGATTGVFATARLRGNWSLGIGLNARYRPGDWKSNDSSIITQVDYSYGFDITTTERREIGVIYLEIPLALVWHHGVFNVEAGAAAGSALHAANRFTQINETSLGGKKVLADQLEKSDLGFYRKNYISTFAGAEWRFSKNLGLTLRAHYRFGNLLTDSDAPAVKAGPAIDLGIRWKLF